MKNFNRYLAYCISIILACSSLQAQIIFEENFDYPAGDSLSNAGWEQIRNGDAILIEEPGLTYDGYCLSGIGNAARIKMEGNREVRKSFSSVSSDSVYLSFLINVKDASTSDITAGGLFLYLTPENGSIFSYRIAVWARKSIANNQIGFGVNRGGGIQYTGYLYSMDTTYLLVLKYKFDPDTTDIFSMWVNPDLSQPESTPDVIQHNGNDMPELSNIIISQLNASNEPPDALIDGIRIAASWESLPVSVKETAAFSASHFQLNQNYPNPFNPNTVISYQLSAKLI